MKSCQTQDPELVAQVVEIRGLVGGGPRDAKHVHAAVADQFEHVSERVLIRGHCDGVRGRPQRAAREHLDAVDADREAVDLDVELAVRPSAERELPEADPAGPHADLAAGYVQAS